MIKEALLVGIGGFAGSVLRYLISYAMVSRVWSSVMIAGVIPLGTLTVNVIGSVLIGIFMALTGQGNWYYLSIIGFCGGFTTFSAFSAELFSFIREGSWNYAIIYILISVILCVLAVWLGLYIGKLLK